MVVLRIYLIIKSHKKMKINKHSILSSIYDQLRDDMSSGRSEVGKQENGILDRY